MNIYTYVKQNEYKRGRKLARPSAVKRRSGRCQCGGLRALPWGWSGYQHRNKAYTPMICKEVHAMAAGCARPAGDVALLPWRWRRMWELLGGLRPDQRGRNPAWAWICCARREEASQGGGGWLLRRSWGGQWGCWGCAWIWWRCGWVLGKR